MILLRRALKRLQPARPAWNSDLQANAPLVAVQPSERQMRPRNSGFQLEILRRLLIPTSVILASAFKGVAPRESEREDWMKTIKARSNAGRADDVIADLKLHRRLEAVATCIRTDGTNRDRMRCDFGRKRGLPVGSGVAVHACKQIVAADSTGRSPLVEGGSQCPARRQMLPEEQQLARLP